MISMNKYNFLIIALAFLQLSCSQQDKNTKQEIKPQAQNTIKRVSVIKVDSPKDREMFTIGDEIDIQLTLKESDIVIDSLIAETKGKNIKLLPEELGFKWQTKHLTTGTNQLKISAYSEGNRVDSYYLRLRFKSDIKPELYECKIINTYPHDKKAYTQGLFYDNGVMYEGTGQRGESSLRKVDYKTGKLIAQLNLEAKYFGEGITAFKDKIIQLTWTSKTGFVYDKATFKLITTLQYSTQGWGITSDGEQLIMSDGTQNIYFLDPEYFNKIGKIEIYDQDGPVHNINELEYINGLVYANIWQSEHLIAFDPKTGKVVKLIDCRKIVPAGYQGEQDNVLNGIAFDKENDRYFITGKRWPSLFEVKFVKM